MSCYLDSKNKKECFGCEACAQVCKKLAIKMIEDEDGFRYPIINNDLCINCGLCRRVCPKNDILDSDTNTDNKYVFGGYHKDIQTRFDSTSGGAFSAIVEAFCDENYIIFGAESDGLRVFHNYIQDKTGISRFRKSKYSQSEIGNVYIQTKRFLKEGKKVLFSGTPCQIAALKNYLNNTKVDNLLTVEVVCEGVPTPLYVRKLDKFIYKKYGSKIKNIDYRYTGRSLGSDGKWDFQQMRIELNNSPKVILRDRWINPFWSIWLSHLMSRPSCYTCPFATQERIADITLGDLWGVHLYCPELYGKNGGASLVVCNTIKGINVFSRAKSLMYGHELNYNDALKYQSPMRQHISDNPNKENFMYDLRSDLDYESIIKKWWKKPTLRLLWQKYIWGNRQKIFCIQLKKIFL